MLDFFFQGLFNTDISGVISFGDFLLCMGCSLLIDQLRCRNGNLEITLSIQESAPAEL